MEGSATSRPNAASLFFRSVVEDSRTVESQNGDEATSAALKTIENGFNYGLFISQTVLYIICLLINSYALVSVYRDKTNQLASNFLHKNLIFTSIITTFIGVLGRFDALQLIKLQGKWLCGVWYALRRISLSSLSTTMMFISYQKIRSKRFRKSFKNNGRGLPTKRVRSKSLLIASWIISFLFGLPAGFKYTYVTSMDLSNTNQCVEVQIFGSNWITLMYETTYTVCLQFFPSIYMVYVLYKIQFRMEYLFLFEKVPDGWKRMVRRLRLVFFFTVSYIILWVPVGWFYLWNEINICFFNVKIKRIDESTYSWYDYSEEIIRTILIVLLSLHPLVYMYSYQNLTKDLFLSRCPQWLKDLCCCKTAVKNTTGDKFDIWYSGVRMETFNRTKEEQELSISQKAI